MRKFFLFLLMPAIAGATPAVRGKIYDIDGDYKTVLFNFERQETQTGGKRIVEGRFTDAATGAVAVYEKVTYNGGNSRFQDYYFDRPQSGEKAWMTIKEGRVLFKHEQDGKISENSEKLDENTINRDEIVPLIHHDWDKLVKGEKIKARFILPDRAETIGFGIRKESEIVFNGKPAYRLVMSPLSPFIALIAKDTFLTIERDGEKRLLQVEGRQPVLKKVDGKLKNLRGRFEFFY